MKTKLQAACDHADKPNMSNNRMFRSCTIEDFNAGIEFAESWISIEEDLPEDEEDVIVSDDSDDWDKACYLQDEKRWHFSNQFSSLGTITHWRPITRQ